MSIFNGFPWIPVFPQHRIPSGASSGMLLHPHGPRKVDHPSLGSTGKKKKIFHIVDFKFHSCPSPIFVSDVMPLDHVGPTLSSLIDQGIFKKKKKKVIKSHDYCRFGGGGLQCIPMKNEVHFFYCNPSEIKSIRNPDSGLLVLSSMNTNIRRFTVRNFTSVELIIF